MRTEIKTQAQELKSKHGITPGLAVVLVGQDPASQVYVRMKGKACAEAEFFSDEHKLPVDTSEADLLELVAKLNADDRIHGILVQLPLPKHIDESKILLAIDPAKDVDGFHPTNVGKMMVGQETFLPCTPHGVVQMLIRSGVEIPGKHVVIVGRSNIVGRPLMNMLSQKNDRANATVTCVHTRTRNMTEITRQADILIAAAGRPKMVTADMVKDGVVVIDVGVNRVDDPSAKRGYRLVGDVDFEAVKEKAAAISPVPGGVGPMTITMLLYNTIASVKAKLGIE
jgi:methylenetetrahydrofolate dehydrogenase (NADP+)/methenyltetrahydrofolate cyclohydrolase